MAHTSLFPRSMRHRNLQDRRCTYLVAIEAGSAGDLREFAAYLSTLSVANCEVIVLDSSPAAIFERHGSVLRWVARHMAPRTRPRSLGGTIDLTRAALDLASCDRIIVADPHVRYGTSALDEICALLDLHEVVEPQDYVEPLPWWGGIEAGRMLVHRGIDPLPDHGATFAFRRSSVRGLRGVGNWSVPDDPVRRLAAQGAEVFSPFKIFVRRKPPVLSDWLRQRPRQADDDFSFPVKTALFFALLPVALLLGMLGGVPLAGGYAGAIAVGSLALAVRGRLGAAEFFPLRICLYAPLWVLERSVSVYWALFRKLRGAHIEPSGVPVPDRASERVASGE